jgi:hypothetical protein
MRTASPEAEIDIATLTSALCALSIGSVMTYQEIDDALGRKLSQRHHLNAAIKRAEKQTGSIFSIVRAVGVKRLQSSDIAGFGLSVMGRIRRAASRGVSRLDTVRVNDLSQGERNKVIAHKSQLAAISLVADGRRSISVANQVEASGGAIPTAKVLELFLR